MLWFNIVDPFSDKGVIALSRQLLYCKPGPSGQGGKYVDPNFFKWINMGNFTAITSRQ